jgi:undecaprenyl-diphosphatase
MIMGLMQSVAVLPGVSRSGSTIFGGIAGGGERKSVARFSFFLSVPIIAGAAAFSLISGGGEAVGAGVYVAGMITAFVSGFFAVRFMLKIIARANFKWFSLYLVVLSIVTFFVYFI